MTISLICYLGNVLLGDQIGLNRFLILTREHLKAAPERIWFYYKPAALQSSLCSCQAHFHAMRLAKKIHQWRLSENRASMSANLHHLFSRSEAWGAWKKRFDF